MLSIFSQITVVNDTFLKRQIIPHSTWKKKQESLIIYTASLPVVLYLAHTTAQSAQCSCVAGGTDEVAGWRWGFPAPA